MTVHMSRVVDFNSKLFLVGFHATLLRCSTSTYCLIGMIYSQCWCSITINAYHWMEENGRCLMCVSFMPNGQYHITCHVCLLPSFSVIFISIWCCKRLMCLRRNVGLRPKALITKTEFLSWHYPIVLTVSSSYNGRYPSKATVQYSVWINEVFSLKVVKRVLLVCLARPAFVKVLSLEDVLVARLLAVVGHLWVICFATCSNCVSRGQHLEILYYSSPVPCMPLLFCFRYVGIINNFV